MWKPVIDEKTSYWWGNQLLTRKIVIGKETSYWWGNQLLLRKPVIDEETKVNKNKLSSRRINTDYIQAVKLFYCFWFTFVVQGKIFFYNLSPKEKYTFIICRPRKIYFYNLLFMEKYTFIICRPRKIYFDNLSAKENILL